MRTRDLSEVYVLLQMTAKKSFWYSDYSTRLRPEIGFSYRSISSSSGGGGGGGGGGSSISSSSSSSSSSRSSSSVVVVVVVVIVQIIRRQRFCGAVISTVR